MRVDERRREHEPGPSTTRWPFASSVGADLRDHAAVDADVEHRVDPLRRVEDARAADHDVVCACASRRASRDPHGGLDGDRAARQQVVEHRHPHDEARRAPGRRSERRVGVGDARVDLDAAVHRARMHHALAGPHAARA